MKKCMLVFMLMMIMLGLNACACNLFPEKLVYSPGLEKKFEELDIPVAVVVSKKGEIAAYDKDGNILDICVVPKEGREDKKGLKPCSGVGADRKIIFTKKLKMIGSHGSPFCIIIVDIHGRAWEYCVDVP